MHEQPPETHPTGRTGQGPAKRCAALCAIGIVFFPYLQSVAFHILSPAECDRRQVKVPLMGRCRAFAQGRCQARTKPPRTG